MTNSIGDIHLADVLLVTGSNTTEAHPVISLEMKKAVRQRGAKLILIDPREIELADFAAIHLRPRSGTDIALLNAMAHVIIAEGLANKEFIAVRTVNFDALAEAVKDCTPQWAEDITGIPAGMLIEAAQVYARAGSAAIFWAMGITQSTHGVDNVQALANLALLTGNFGRPGTGVNPLRGQNNVQGACDVGGLPNVLTAYQSVTDEAIRTKFEMAWGSSVKIPAKPGLTVTELMNGALHGNIKALYVMGENPFLSDPNMNHVEQALRAIRCVDQAGLKVGVTSQVNQGNLSELEFLAPILEDAGVLGWQLQLTLPLGRAEENRHLITPPAVMPELLRVLRRLARRPGLRPHLTDNIGYGTSDDIALRTIQGGFPRPWLGCRAGLDALGVTSDGRVKGCLALPDICTEGNVREESLCAIWNDPNRFSYNRHYTPAQLSGACADCEQAQRCRGGCTATAYAMHGKPGVSTHCFLLNLRSVPTGIPTSAR